MTRAMTGTPANRWKKHLAAFVTALVLAVATGV